MFEGHQLHILDDEWVFDLTTFIGYHTTLSADKRNITSYNKAFVVIRDKTTGAYIFDKKMQIPIKILKKVVRVIVDYRMEALLEHGNNR